MIKHFILHFKKSWEIFLFQCKDSLVFGCDPLNKAASDNYHSNLNDHQYE